MVTSLGSVIALALACTPVSAANKHVHGHGQLLIAQDDSDWQLQFSIPAADLLGFEHEPENDEQQQTLRDISAIVNDFSSVASVAGDCEVAEKNVDMPHLKHKAHDEHGEHHHEDISLAYTLSCSNSMTGITVRLFDFAPSLSALEVQWINNKGQGMTDVTPQAASINW